MPLSVHSDNLFTYCKYFSL